MRTIVELYPRMKWPFSSSKPEERNLYRLKKRLNLNQLQLKKLNQSQLQLKKLNQSQLPLKKLNQRLRYPPHLKS